MKKSYVRAGHFLYKKLLINKIRESGHIEVIYLYSGVILTEALSIFAIEKMQCFLFISRNYRKEKRNISNFSDSCCVTNRNSLYALTKYIKRSLLLIDSDKNYKYNPNRKAIREIPRCNAFPNGGKL
jgi:hypothetical protein